MECQGWDILLQQWSSVSGFIIVYLQYWISCYYSLCFMKGVPCGTHSSFPFWYKEYFLILVFCNMLNVENMIKQTSQAIIPCYAHFFLSVKHWFYCHCPPGHDMFKMYLTLSLFNLNVKIGKIVCKIRIVFNLLQFVIQIWMFFLKKYMQFCDKVHMTCKVYQICTNFKDSSWILFL